MVLSTAGLALIGLAAAQGAVGGRASFWESGPLLVNRPRVVVIKSKHALYLFDGDRLVRRYAIDLGLAPVGPKRVKNDYRTPEGVFHVVYRNAASPYHRFIGLDYPDPATAEWGFSRGLISNGEREAVHRAWAGGERPDWTTALGGGIGLHGRRIGRDWTAGCVALADGQVEELFQILRVGDTVEILP